MNCFALTRRLACALACWAAVVTGSLPAADLKPQADPLDWPTWRGPEMNGISREKNLPSSWSPQGENLLWAKEEYASRSTPIVMDGRLYTMCRAFPETTKEGEKVVCLDAETGELIWEAINNVYLTDAPAERVGWSSVVGDPETGNVYALGLGCYFQCLDGQTGEQLWQHSMSEEYGLLSTYGGRTNFPILFEDLVIISGVMTGWGELAMPAHRFIAFNKHTGEAVWLASTRLRPEDTTYSTPVLTVFDGEAALVVAAGDGAVYAIQPRTGKTIWKYQASNRGINTTMLVSDNIVYGGHSEQNTADIRVLGAAFAFDGRTHGEIEEDDLLWKVRRRTVGRSAPLLVDGRLYMIDDGATLYVMDPKTGEDIAEKKLGRIMFGSPVYGDGKIYVGESSGRFYILEPTEDGVKVLDQLRLNNEEILGSPVISHGRVYIPSTGALYCIGLKDAEVAADPRPEPPKEAPVSEDQEIAQLQVVPVEAMLKPGEKLEYEVQAFNAKGQPLDKTLDDVKFSVKGPGEISESGVYSSPSDTGHEGVLVTASLGELTSPVSRIRVMPGLPWSFDFEDGQVPITWIGVAYRHKAAQVDGENVLVKVSTITKGTRSRSWMGWPHLHDYTIQADFKATMENGKIPDMGLICQRYTLDLMSAQQLQVRSWASRLHLRFAKTVPFQWQADTWYTIKFQSENRDGQAVLRGKVWPRGTPEPDEWHLEAADAVPNTVGSPGLYGDATAAEYYIDNIKVYPNGGQAVSTR